MADAPKPLTDAQKQLLDNLAKVDPTGEALKIGELLLQEGRVGLNSPNIVTAGITEEQWSHTNRDTVIKDTKQLLADRVIGALDERVANGETLNSDTMRAFRSLGMSIEQINRESDAINSSPSNGPKITGRHGDMLDAITARLQPLTTGGDVTSYTPPVATPAQPPAPGTQAPQK